MANFKWNSKLNYHGIELRILGENEFSIHHITGFLKNDEFEIKSSREFSSWDEFLRINKRGLRTYLSVLGSNVLTKFSTEATDPLKALQLEFPNLSLQDFFYQITEFKNGYLVSVVRQALIIDLVNNSPINILGIELGIGVIKHLELFTSNLNLNIDKFHISTAESGFMVQSSQFEQLNSHPHIGDLKLTPSQLIPLATTFNNFQSTKSISNLESFNQQLLKTNKEKNLFKNLASYGFLFILFILLINFFLFLHYSSRSNQLTEKVLLLELNNSDLIEIKREIEKKKNQVENTQFISNSRTIFFINRIVNSLPTYIQLQNLKFQPLEQKLKEGAPLKIDANTIVLEGEIKNSNSITTWISELEKFTWITQIDILEFKFLSEEKSSFILLLNITGHEIR